MTMCCCVNAVGTALPPAYVFPRVHFKNIMLKGAPNGSLGLAAPSGWMNGELFVEVLRHFIKFMNASKEEPAVLFMDNHESHVSLEVIDMARENGLVIVSFPPHCSHRMQPLDVSVYGPFKRAYNTACNNWMTSHPGQVLTIYDVAELSCTAFNSAFTVANISSGFKKAGLYPLDENIFSEDEFLPSAPTD